MSECKKCGEPDEAFCACGRPGAIAVGFGDWLDANVKTEKYMTKTKYEIELETKLLKAWAETVYEKHLRQEAVQTLQELNQRVHGGYDFNADPDNMTARVSGEITKQLFAIHRASNDQAQARLPDSAVPSSKKGNKP